MKSKFIIFLTLLIVCQYASANVYFIQLNNGDIGININEPACIKEKRSWNNKSFQVEYKIAGSLQWQGQTSFNGASAFYWGHYFQNNTRYIIRVKYYGKSSNCTGLNSVRTLGETSFTYRDDIHQSNLPVIFQDITPNYFDYRLKNVLTNKCIYPFTSDGTLGSLYFYNWDCNNHDNYAFYFTNLGNNKYKMRSRVVINDRNHFCLVPKNINHTSSQFLTVGKCDSDAEYEAIMLSSDTFKLRNVANNKCLHANTNNGGFITQGNCSTGSSLMTFKVEGY